MFKCGRLYSDNADVAKFTNTCLKTERQMFNEQKFYFVVGFLVLFNPESSEKETKNIYEGKQVLPNSITEVLLNNFY